LLSLAIYRFQGALHRKPYGSNRRHHIDRRDLKLVTGVPVLPASARARLGDNVPGRFLGRLAPIADLRVLILDPNKPAPVIDAVRHLGISSVWIALATAILLTGALFPVFYLFLKRMARGGNLLLALVADPNGYLDLARAQLFLWTVSVFFSFWYCMALIGDLPDVTSSTLVLLGLSGVTGIAVRLAEKQALARSSRPPTSTAGPSNAGIPAMWTPAEDHGATASLDLTTHPDPPHRRPRWSDLVVSHESFDVFRLQMLFFTILASGGFLIEVITGFRFPEIPSGVLALFGTSNAIYLLSTYLEVSSIAADEPSSGTTVQPTQT